MKTAIALILSGILMNFSLSAHANDVAPPSLEDPGYSFITNNGDTSEDMTPDGNAQEMAPGASEDFESEPVPVPAKPSKPRASKSPAPAVKKGFCEVRIILKCEGQEIKDRQAQIHLEGVAYTKNTNDKGELVESLSCPTGAKGKKFLLKFAEFKAEIALDKVPYMIDIPKRQCL